MPFKGECFRLEGRFSTKGKEKLADSLPRIAAVSGDNDEDEANHPFTTLEDMLLNGCIQRTSEISKNNKGGLKQDCV